MARKNKIVEAPAETPIKERLLETIKSLEERLSTSRTTQREARKNEREWKERVAYARELLEGTKDPDAIEAITILKSQAEEYHAIYTKSSTEDNDYIASIEDQLSKLRKSLETLDLMEKKKELTEHLRSIASKGSIAAIPQGESSGTVESREIDSLIHTAQALVELRGDKAA